MEGAERVGGLIVRPAGWATDDQAARTTQAKLEPGKARVVRHQIPVDESDAARHIELAQALVIATADIDERCCDALRRCARNAAHPRGLKRPPTNQRNACRAQAPTIDPDALNGAVFETQVLQGRGDILSRCAVLRGTGRTKTKLARPDRRDVADDAAQPPRRDRQALGERQSLRIGRSRCSSFGL